ncbi:hypothetical protein IMZ48_46435, partial [Candidatus Bathyarchaeota archaeon]|nr:hypothetical protein [Candidatus Bathyarchaeota archaeon]
EKDHRERLTKAQDGVMVAWVRWQCESGARPTQIQLRERAQELLADAGDLKPLSVAWGRNFVKRHPEMPLLKHQASRHRLDEGQMRELVEWAVGQCEQGLTPRRETINLRVRGMLDEAGDNEPIAHTWVGNFLRRYPEAAGGLTLDDAQKRDLSAWIWSRHETGSPANLDQIQGMAQGILDAAGVDGPLVRTWAEGFMQRYHELPRPSK